MTFIRVVSQPAASVSVSVAVACVDLLLPLLPLLLQ